MGSWHHHRRAALINNGDRLRRLIETVCDLQRWSLGIESQGVAHSATTTKGRALGRVRRYGRRLPVLRPRGRDGRRAGGCGSA